MTKYLIQKPSGHIYVATPALEKRKDMYLYEPEKEAIEETPQSSARESEENATILNRQTGEESDLKDLRQQYKQVFGRAAPPKAKAQTLRTKINNEALKWQQ